MSSIAGKIKGGGYGTFGNFVASLVGELLPSVDMWAVFTATGPTSAVPVPSGVATATIQGEYIGGAPTAATVVVQGSTDGGKTWVTMPATATPDATMYTQVRLNCTALTGGTSPVLVVAALVAP